MGGETSYTSRSEYDYSQSYHQQYNGQTATYDSYGTTQYDRYRPSYAYEMPTGKDGYGNPIYGS
jgi:hypothetical protein